jgi:hypothetical protein
MRLVEIDWDPSVQKLRHFASLLFVVFAALDARVVWRGGSHAVVTILSLVAALGLGGLARPSMVRPVYKTWMYLSLPIGWAGSHLLMMSAFYLVVAPIGVVMRLFGYDPLARRFDPSRKTYWMQRDRKDKVSRYFKQF